MGPGFAIPYFYYGGFGEIVGHFSRAQSTGFRTQSYQVRLSGGLDGAFFFGLGALPMPVFLHCFRRSP
jgi:hypothetical protein